MGLPALPDVDFVLNFAASRTNDRGVDLDDWGVDLDDWGVDLDVNVGGLGALAR